MKQVLWQARDLNASHSDRPHIRRINPGDQASERGLARARRPHDREPLPRTHSQANIPKNRFALPIAERHVLDLDDVTGGSVVAELPIGRHLRDTENTRKCDGGKLKLVDPPAELIEWPA